MGACPFCRGEVGEELLRNGGHCPHCLIEIPGEETPTDPGETAKALQQAEEQAVRSSRTGLIAGVAAVAAVGIGVAAWFALAEEEPVGQIEIAEFHFAPVSEHKDLEMPGGEPEDAAAQGGSQAAVASRTPSSTPSSRKSASRATSAPPTGGQLPEPEASAGPAQGSLRPSVGGAPAGDPLAAFNIGGGGPGSKGPEAIVLEGWDKISEGVRNAVYLQMGQLNQCYQQRLKEDDSIRGMWTVSFVVQTNGRASNVGAVGDGVSDKALEECLVRQVQGWNFPRIAEPFSVDTPVRFGKR